MRLYRVGATQKCPGCGRAVPADVSICPHCDFIIDASFLDAPASSASRRDTPPAGGPSASPKHAPPPPPAPRPIHRADPTEASEPPSLPEKFIADVRDFIAGLAFADKLALAGAAATIVSCAFPWKESAAEGEVLGLASLGFLVFVATVLGLLSLVVRTRKMMPGLNPVLPWLVQLGAFGFSIFWCMVYIKVSWDGRLVPSPVGNFQMWASKPAFGVVLALLASGLGLGGTLIGLQSGVG